MLPFLDRERETGRLARAVGRGDASFCCVYGRRRCGKSRLLQEVLPQDRTAFYAADEREATLQRASAAAAMSAVAPGMDRVVYPEWASLFEWWWRSAPAGSVLVLDEFPYLVGTSPEVPSILQRLIDAHASSGVHLVLCGSSQRMMQGLVLDGSAPLYGRAREILNVRPLGMAWLGEALSLARPIDIVRAYSVWGGVPRYWELASEHRSLWESIEEVALDPLGVLQDEPARLLMDDMRDTVQAASILALVGAGCTRVSEIAGRLAKPATSLGRPIQRLLELGFLRRELPFGDPQRGGKRTSYAIADPFLAFWFRYVEPNRSRLQAGMVGAVRLAVEADFPNHAASIWEAEVRDAFARMCIEGIDWMPAARWWGAGTDRRPLEVDIVAESVDRRTLFVGEAKLRLSAAEAGRVQRELDDKVSRLPFASSYERVLTGIFPAEFGGAKPPPGVVRAEDVVAACR